MTRQSRDRLCWWVLLVLSLMPFLLLLVDTATDRLGANAVQTLYFRTGHWALTFLIITLGLSPWKILTGQTWQLRYRRMMGLFAFFYAAVHLTVYVVLDHTLSWQSMRREFPETPYLWLGLFCFLMMLPLAATSTRRSQRLLGKNWKGLHRLVFVAGVAAVIHYFFLVKGNYSEPLFYASLMALFLGTRMLKRFRMHAAGHGAKLQK